MTPRKSALAFRIWQHCTALEWNLTATECAEALGESRYSVTRICQAKGWLHRMRVCLVYQSMDASRMYDGAGIDLQDHLAGKVME